MLLAGGVQSAADLAGELNGGLVGLSTGVGNEDLGRIAHSTGLVSQLDQQLTQSTGPRVVVKVGGVDKCFSLQLSIVVSN